MVAKRRQGAIVACLIAPWVLLSAGHASAAGSQNLYPSGAGGSRANTEWRTSTYGGSVYRRTLIHAYATAGQYLLLGSTAVGVGSADILVWDPGLVTGAIGHETVPATPSYSCEAQRISTGTAAQGQIASRTEELAGPDTVPAGGVTNGYVPCYYQAPSTGVYSIAMVGPLGISSNTDATVAADVVLTNAGDFDASQSSSVAAWDVTLRDTLIGAVSHAGRVFTYVLALFTGGNGRPVDAVAYPVTLDGYRYLTDDRGMDPNGWVQFGNQVGFLDPDGATPLYHDAIAAAGTSGSAAAQLVSIQGGVLFAQPLFPIFFEPPDPVVLTALNIPLTPVAPAISSVGFSGTQNGSTSYFQTGGTFSFTANVGGVYQVVISHDGIDFDPDRPSNRVLRGVRAAGTQTVSWDGKDNAGSFFPVGANYPFRMALHAGEYHFPAIDDENSTLGGPAITLQNPPGGTCPPIAGGCSGGFYDDRGYTTSTGQTVGTEGTVLCGNAPPSTPSSDPFNGFDTSSGQRSFGTSSGGNTNAPCTGSFGDAKGLDLWTYYPSNQASGQLSIVASTPSADIRVAKTGPASVHSGEAFDYVIHVYNAGPAIAIGPVSVIDTLPAGLAYVSSTGSGWACSAVSRTVTCTHAGDLASGAAEPVMTVRVTASTLSGSAVINTANATSTTSDPDTANNTSSFTSRVSAPTIPLTGAADILPMLLAGVLLIGGGLAITVTGLRRRFPS